MISGKWERVHFPLVFSNLYSMTTPEDPPQQHGEITIFETEDGKTRVEVRFHHDNVWLTQKLMAQLYECSTDNISLHLRNIFADRELVEASVAEESSVTAADGKNYRTNHIVDMYLDHAEFQASRARPMRMQEWAAKLDAFLQFNEQEILHDHGKVSHAVALTLAEEHYQSFRISQDQSYESDFDRLLQHLPSPNATPPES